VKFYMRDSDAPKKTLEVFPVNDFLAALDEIRPGICGVFLNVDQCRALYDFMDELASVGCSRDSYTLKHLIELAQKATGRKP
jgi:hypothetical protein